MDSITLYFRFGFGHILNTGAIDHLLFLVTLCVVYSLFQWKPLLILITAFTIGHTISLVMSTFRVISINADLVEILIPVTILCTALYNLFRSDVYVKSMIGWNYILAMAFGLVHGLGFSNNLRFLLQEDESLWGALLGFNMGVEAGQIIFAGGFVLLTFLLVQKIRLPQKLWKYCISVGAAGISLFLIAQRIVEIFDKQ